MREGWKQVSLNELGFVGRGKSRHRPRNAEFLYNGPYPFIQTGDVEAARFYINSYSQTYSDLGLAQSKLWPKGTLCISIVGANTGASAILGFDACFPDSIICFTANETKSDVKFVKYTLELMRSELKSISQGAARENLSLEKLLSIKFLVPDVLIQKKIVSDINPYDDLIENNLKRIKLLEEKAQLTYEEWFVKMRFPGYETAKFDDVTGLPEGWEKKEFQYFGKVITGKTPSTKNELFFDGNIPFVKTPDMAGFPYVLDCSQQLSELGGNSQQNKFIPKNTLMISCIGSAGAFALASEDCQTNQQINSIIFYQEYYTFYFYCLAKGLKPILEGLGSNGATMTNVNKSKFEKIDAVFPELQLLKHYHDIVKNNFEIILALQKQNRLLKEARDILLPRLMSGMIDVDSITGQVGAEMEMIKNR